MFFYLVIHADNDSATTSKLKVDFEDLEKRDEKNHLKKGLSKSLHQMSIKYKELKQDDTREYILRCFMYAITGGTTEDDIKVSLDRIVPHIFGNHDSCREVTWCKYEEDPTNFKYRSLPGGNPLTNESLKEELLVLVSKYTSQSNAIAELGSTQANESFNQMASSKAPKSRHYGGSCSLKNRLSAAVLKKKNEGYSYLPKVNEASNLSPGDFTTSLTLKMDAKRKKESRNQIKKNLRKGGYLNYINLFSFRIVVRWSGSTHDSFMLTNSSVPVYMELIPNSWLLGDSGYPLKKWLMTPLLHTANDQEVRFNTARQEMSLKDLLVC
ncbi:unnamed protein product [Mytilus edulis]|uniref:DDE Tnp4 domain-containing protein n=1 Tax=Mytilus edulis TaxID=6550 RepID=A0A8S3ULV1_MYTED|nr:unnamed protein product [Mytilus edulis]